ncbi:MAG: N-acetyl-gamma-glutamyl-phosphate reductase, partial [Chthoniobacterales bacterium]
MEKVKAAIVGASGYSGEELVALLARHPQMEIVALTSRQSAGQTVAEVFPRMGGSDIAGMKFVEPSAEALKKCGASVVFLALPHGLAAEFAAPLRKAGIQVVDLS